MQSPSNMAVNSEDWSWHLVNGDSESETHSERAMSVVDGSRPQTPAVILMPDHEPPSPESERLADTLLGTPVPATVRTLMGSANRLQEVQADTAGAHDHAAEEVEAAHHVAAAGLSPGGEETVGVHCLQALSQEGSLEGFSAAEAAVAASDATDGNADGGSSLVRKVSSEIAAADGEHKNRSSEDGGGSSSSPWQGMDEQQLLEMDEGLGLRWLLDLCSNGLTHLGNDLAGLHRTLATAAARALTRVTGAAVGSSSSSDDPMDDDEDAIAAAKLKTTDGRSLRAVLRQCTGAAAERPGLLLSALGLSTLAATVCLGLVYYYMARCRNLSASLQQRDKELARLMMKVLNLQEALQLPRAMATGPPILRHTSHTGHLLSGLGYSMM